MVLIIPIVLLLPLILLVVIALLKGLRETQGIREVELSDCTLIIPFRNEAENLQTLTERLRAQNKMPKAIIFVNDHSTDNSVMLMEQELKSNPHWRLIHAKETGKKSAIAAGVNLVKTEYCITMDADVTLLENYFNQRVESADLMILPVVMHSKTVFGTFAAIEYNLFNALNILLGKIYMLSCSGANLMFRVASFKEVQHEMNKISHASGDDYFLLRAMQKRKMKIGFSLNYDNSVTTHGAETYTGYLQQRLRWIGKTGGSSDWLSQVFGVIIALYFIGALVGVVAYAYQGNWLLLCGFISFRFMFELAVFLPYQFGLRNKTSILYFLFFSVIYPLLFFALLFGSVFIRPKWKGR
jgi:glycosyltransferase involved in cell wall biosynthesis